MIKKIINKEYIFVFITLCIGLIALLFWWHTPLYYDEISFRKSYAVMFRDNFIYRGPFDLCISQRKEIPLVFYLPSFILSILDRFLTPYLFRLISLFCVMSLILTSSFLMIRKDYKFFSFFCLMAFIGVSGSSLIFARYEILQELNLAICLMGLLHILNHKVDKKNITIILFFLALSSLLCIYPHIQGLLFLPLTVFIGLVIIIRARMKIIFPIFWIMVFAYIILEALEFHQFVCSEYPEIQSYSENMTLQLSNFDVLSTIQFIKEKVEKYTDAFIYKETFYTEFYIPGLLGLTKHQKWLISLLNSGIRISLIANILILTTCFIQVSLIVTKYLIALIINKHNTVLQKVFLFADDDAIILKCVFFAISVCVLFLLIYDTTQNFYRSIFINLVGCIAITLYLSSISNIYLAIIFKIYTSFCVAIVLLTMSANAIYFMPKLSGSNGYIGPLVSINTDWTKIDKEAGDLSKKCEATFDDGEIIMDDYSYNFLKSYPHLSAITFLNLHAVVTKQSIKNLITERKPNYAIARCMSLKDIYEFSQNKLSVKNGDICCINFKRSR